jgi:hypothetical protein
VLTGMWTKLLELSVPVTHSVQTFTQGPLQNSGEMIKSLATNGRRSYYPPIPKSFTRDTGKNTSDRRSEARGPRPRALFGRCWRTYGDERGAKLAQDVQKDGAASAIAPQFHGPGSQPYSAPRDAPGCAP